MEDEWTIATVGDAFDLVTGYAFKSSDFIQHGVPVIKIKNVKAGEFSEHEFSYVSDSFLDERSEKLARPGDLLISMSGNRHDGSPETWVGKIAEFRKPGDYLLNQRVGALRLKDGARVDSRFASYLLSSFPYQQLFIAIATSSGGQANLSPAQILGAHMRFPDLGSQREIAHILGTLDEKIELNRRMNETLEAMARALFKSWFVDFDPVRAKAEGRDPGLSGHIADLFADRLVQSELGETPDGWALEPFSETVEMIGGGTPKTSVEDYWNGQIPWFSVVDAPRLEDVWVLGTEKAITPAGLENSSTKILPVGTTIISARGTVGRLALVGAPMAMNQSCYGLRGRSGALGFYNYFVTRQLVRTLQQRAHGSVFDTITRETLAGVSVAVPPTKLIDIFEAQIGSTLERIRVSLLESRTLSTLRDALLPKLISGQLRVGLAERTVEQVA